MFSADCDHYVTPKSRWWLPQLREHEPKVILADETSSPRFPIIMGLVVFAAMLVLGIRLDLWFYLDDLHESFPSGATALFVVLGFLFGLAFVFYFDHSRRVYRRWHVFENRIDVWHKKFARSYCERIRRESLHLVESRFVYAPNGETGTAKFLAAETLDPNAWILLDINFDDAEDNGPGLLLEPLNTSLFGRERRLVKAPGDRTPRVITPIGDLPVVQREEPMRFGFFTENHSALIRLSTR